MNIQDHLAAFDGWLTDRIDEAYGAGKDLAFRDTGAEIRLGETGWEHRLIEPGARSPRGEGWSVYRLHGRWPELDEDEVEAAAASGARRTFMAMLADTLFGPEGARAR